MQIADFRQDLWQRLRPMLACALLGLALVTLSRIGLSLWHADQVRAANGWAPLLVGGLRVDIATLGLLFGMPAVLALLVPMREWAGRLAWRLLDGWLLLSVLTLLFLEAATPDFMAEYGLRPNRLFLEYLLYPKEVLSTLLHGHLLSTLLGVSAVALVGWGLWRGMRRLRSASSLASSPWWLRLPLAMIVLLLSALAVRSTVSGHRPLNPAMVAFSSDPTVNQLPLNSTYALLNAARDWLGEGETGAIYGAMPWPEVVARVRRETGLPTTAYVDPSLPTLARHVPVYHGKPRNLVILLEESLGAQFIGHLGGRRLSPQLDELSKQAWTFTSMYATGTRSVRGIEAVVTGFTPTPAQAVVKLPGSQTGFFSLADVLARHGYDTTFYYGGESHFDNMRSFFLGNGFKRIIDQRDFAHPAFTGSWGVSDEDLVRRADAEFKQLHAAGKPFFGLVFSSSNHDPFEFPEGRITLAGQPKQTRDNAAKYADYAIGEFFRLAKNSPYWNDTVFLVVADHDSRVLGHDLVPIANFHIPALLLGADIAPHMDDRIASQIDLPPTLLSLLGFGDATPMTGHDLNDDRAQRPGRAMMQYDLNFAWMRGSAVTILSPQHAPRGYVWDAAHQQLQPGPLDPEGSRTALAVALWGSEAYRRKLYRSAGQGQ